MKIQELQTNQLKKEQSESKPKDYWRVSEMGQCLRKRWLRRKGEKRAELDDKTQWLFECGKAIHSQMQWILKRSGDMIACEEEVKGLGYVGHFDGLIQVEDKIVLVDWKSTGKWKLMHLEKNGVADDHTVKQLLTYYLLLKDEHDIDEARVIYIDREDLNKQVEFTYWLTPKWEKIIMDEIKKLDEYWEKGILPPPTPIYDWQCGYCNVTSCESCGN